MGLAAWSRTSFAAAVLAACAPPTCRSRPRRWTASSPRSATHSIPRRYGLENRERTNRLLMLMQLRANGQDDQTAYAKSIRAWLVANEGRPRVLRRAVTDRRSSPSLR